MRTDRMSDSLDLHASRYARQMRFGGVGVEGQRKLLASRALVVGCGALGSVIANTLARAGVGKLRIVDRDFLELNNLQRQVLYDEDDVAAKAGLALQAPGLAPQPALGDAVAEEQDPLRRHRHGVEVSPPACPNPPLHHRPDHRDDEAVDPVRVHSPFLPAAGAARSLLASIANSVSATL